MKAEKYLSIVLLVLSQLMSCLVLLLLPTILGTRLLDASSTNDTVKLSTLRDILVPFDELPIPTVHALHFTDLILLRWSLFIIFVVIGFLVEIRCGQKKISGTYHAICLAVSIAWGGYYLLACILPFMPL